MIKITPNKIESRLGEIKQLNLEIDHTKTDKNHKLKISKPPEIEIFKPKIDFTAKEKREYTIYLRIKKDTTIGQYQEGSVNIELYDSLNGIKEKTRLDVNYDLDMIKY